MFMVLCKYFFFHSHYMLCVLDDPFLYGSVQQHIHPLTLDGGTQGCLEPNLQP